MINKIVDISLLASRTAPTDVMNPDFKLNKMQDFQISFLDLSEMISTFSNLPFRLRYTTSFLGEQHENSTTSITLDPFAHYRRCRISQLVTLFNSSFQNEIKPVELQFQIHYYY